MKLHNLKMAPEANETSNENEPTLLLEHTIPSLEEILKAKEAVKHLANCGIKVLAIGKLLIMSVSYV